MKIHARVKWCAIFVTVFSAAIGDSAKVNTQIISAFGSSMGEFVTEAPTIRMTDEEKTALENKSVSTMATPIERSEGRFFLKVSDITSQILRQNMESIPPSLRGPVMFFMGFGQQSMENFMSNMRSFGRMIITSVVMMAVKRIYFADIPSEADRNKADRLTDSILSMVNLVF